MTNEYQKVEDHPELLRDKHSGAIINNDHTAYQLHEQIAHKNKGMI
jgi:hypothetical protein